ncbi:hypothetical protein C8R43DRAFT_949306 [Mycena crocata]|nr:hypothetical protein C8R43DRAFT_949306 [Mycena crocata]
MKCGRRCGATASINSEERVSSKRPWPAAAWELVPKKEDVQTRREEEPSSCAAQRRSDESHGGPHIVSPPQPAKHETVTAITGVIRRAWALVVPTRIHVLSFDSGSESIPAKVGVSVRECRGEFMSGADMFSDDYPCGKRLPVLYTLSVTVDLLRISTALRKDGDQKNGLRDRYTYNRREARWQTYSRRRPGASHYTKIRGQPRGCRGHVLNELSVDRQHGLEKLAGRRRKEDITYQQRSYSATIGGTHG